MGEGMVGRRENTSSSISKRVKPPYFGSSLGIGGGSRLSSVILTETSCDGGEASPISAMIKDGGEAEIRGC